MTCPHTGYDHDTDCDPECPTCGELTPDPPSHHCIVVTKEPRP